MLNHFDMAVALAESAAILAVLGLVHARMLEVDTKNSLRLRQWLRGLLFGAAALATMMVPVSPEPGLYFDMRAVPLALAALFGGPLAAIVAMVPPSLYRAWLGGAGAVAGIAHIIGAGLLGMAVAHVAHWQTRKSHERKSRVGDDGDPVVGWEHIFVIAALLPAIGMACIPLLADLEQRDRLATTVALLTGIVYPIAVLLCGGLLQVTARRSTLAGQLAAAEHTMAVLMKNTPGVFFRRRSGVDGRISYPMLAGRIERVLGIPGTIAKTNPRSIFIAAHPDDRQLLVKAFDASLRDGSPVAVDIRILPPGHDGTRWLNVIATPAAGRDAAGDFLWDGFVTDITERKGAELALTEARARLEAMAGTDALTGLANRRRFDESLAQEWQRAEREGSALSLIIIDVDSFKLYNDFLGHAAGDSCLRTIARAVSDAARRPADLAARIGGEEFALILPASKEAGAFAIAELLRTLVEEQAHVHPAGGVVTVSIGVATAWPGAEGVELPDRDALLAAADAALYAAKTGGRNCVKCATSRAERFAA